MAKKKKVEREITMRDLYPHLSEEELVEAERNFNRYIEIVFCMYVRRLQGSAGDSLRAFYGIESMAEMRRKRYDSGNSQQPTFGKE